MPELPEVEHARASIEAWCVGRRIERAVVEPSRLLRGAPTEPILRALRGHGVIAAERRGKHLLIALDGDRALHVHLGMSGRFERWPAATDVDRAHVRLELALDDGAIVLLRDTRMLGKLELGSAAELRARIAAELGPDPLLDGLDGRALLARLEGTRRPVKIALMDQAVIAGLGNIYVAESLWRAGIHPDTPASALDARRATRLAETIHEVLAIGLASLRADHARLGQVRYLSDGAVARTPEIGGEVPESARAESPFGVYDREGERCLRCRRGVIARRVQGGRSTFFCPRCQKDTKIRVATRRKTVE